MSKKRFKEKKYLAGGGSKCPYCTSSNVTATGHIEIDGINGWQSVICLDCESEWTDIYTLTGAEEVQNNT